MKVLHFISSGGLFGAENVVLSLGRAMNQNGTTAIIGAIHDLRSPNPALIRKAREEQLPTFVLTSRGRFDWGAVLRLRKFLKDHAIDVLHTHNYKSDMVGWLAARYAGVKVMATAHGFTHVNPSVAFYERVDRWILSHCFDRVVAVADEILPQLGPDRKEVISNGIDTSRFKKDKFMRRKIRERFGFRDDDCVVATVGRLSPEKNQAMLLKAASLLKADHPHIRFLIIGEGPEESSLKRWIDAHQLDRIVRLTGFIDDIAAAYQAMDIFVLSSKTEGIPLTILEAMSAGIPVISTRVGGVTRMIEDHRTGVLVESENAGDLSASIEALAGDADLRNRLSDHAYQLVNEKFSVESMAERYKRLYHQLTLESKRKMS